MKGNEARRLEKHTVFGGACSRPPHQPGGGRLGLAWLAPANLSHNKIVAAPNNRNEIQSSKGVFGRVRYALWGTRVTHPGITYRRV